MLPQLTPRIGRVARALALLAVTACGSDTPSTEPVAQPTPVAQIDLATVPTELTEGDHSQLVAIPRDAAGNVVPDALVAWTSSDPAVVLVSANGAVTARAAGVAMLTATSRSRERSVVMRVVPRVVPVSHIVVDPDALSMAPGETQAVAAHAYAAPGVVLDIAKEWTSSNPAVVTVVAPGRITAHREGSATVTVSARGVSARIDVVVVDDAQYRMPLREGNGRALPALLFSEHLGGGTQFAQYTAYAGEITLLPGGRYAQRFDFMVARPGQPASLGTYVTIGRFEFDGLSDAVRFTPDGGRPPFVLRFTAPTRLSGTQRYMAAGTEFTAAYEVPDFARQELRTSRTR